MKPEIGLEIQGRYELVERIAIGGMGEVWRATDLRSGRAVAAKILRPELTGDEIFLARLRAEAANSRGLRHPNLAVVLDAGERDGSGWIIMELVQGRALSDIIAEKGTLPPADTKTSSGSPATNSLCATSRTPAPDGRARSRTQNCGASPGPV